MELNDIPQDILEVLKSKGDDHPIVLVGASNNPDKYGNVILKNLRAKGYQVVPVNPREKTVEGLTVYSSVTEIDGPVGLVTFVVPPKISLAVMKSLSENRDRDIQTLWFQDGSFNDEVISYAQQHFNSVVYDACIMVVTNYL